jgi:hypothetical protein
MTSYGRNQAQFSPRSYPEPNNNNPPTPPARSDIEQPFLPQPPPRGDKPVDDNPPISREVIKDSFVILNFHLELSQTYNSFLSNSLEGGCVKLKRGKISIVYSLGYLIFISFIEGMFVQLQ